MSYHNSFNIQQIHAHFIMQYVLLYYILTLPTGPNYKNQQLRLTSLACIYFSHFTWGNYYIDIHPVTSPIVDSPKGEIHLDLPMYAVICLETCMPMAHASLAVKSVQLNHTL